MYAIFFYADVKIITILVVFALLITTYVAFRFQFLFKAVIPSLSVISLFLIFYNTVLGRQPSDNHQFLLMADYNGGFWREMLMNAMLFFPLGLSLPHFIRSYKYSILIAFLLSIAIETWQYLAGTGLAQGTDIIMNTLGAAIGASSYIIALKLQRILSKKD